MARAIIRYSASTGAPGNQMRRDIKTAIKNAGFSERRGTAAWEIQDVTPKAIGIALAQISHVIQQADADTLDHLWVYVDNPE